MKPFENDELSDRELDSILRAWDVPQTPVHLRAAVFAKPVVPWWRNLWRASFRVPVPVACILGAILAFAAWRMLSVAPRIEIRTQRIEIPVVRKEVVTQTVYRNRTITPRPASHELRPVAELRPIIIRSQHDQN
jgi:hypothetical protein